MKLHHLLYLSCLLLALSVSRASVIPAASHTLPITPSYALTPPIVTAISTQVVARNHNRLYVPGYVATRYPAYPAYPAYANYPTYTPTTYYKYPASYPYGYGYSNVGYGYNYGGAIW